MIHLWTAGEDVLGKGIGIAIVLVAIFLGGVVHEYGHAWTARRFGDDFAERQGRLTLFPPAHFSFFSTLVLPIITGLFFGLPFGGMKPVPIMPNRLRKPDLHMVFVAAGGPVFQVGFAAVCLGLSLLLSPLILDEIVLTKEGQLLYSVEPSIAADLLMSGFVLNILIACFNLIPIPPLDGSRILRYFFGESGRAIFNMLDRGGLILVFAFIMFGGAGFLREVYYFAFSTWFDAIALVH